MLNHLVEYARREGIDPGIGLKAKTVAWLLLFAEDGRFVGVQSLRSGDRGEGRTFPACPDLTHPEMIGAGAGCRHFLVDSLEVVATLTKDGQVEKKLLDKHAYFVNLLQQASQCEPTMAPLATSLSNDSVLTSIREKLLEHRAKPNDLATVALVCGSGEVRIFVEHDTWQPWWQAFRMALSDARKRRAGGERKAGQRESSQMRCLLSGELIDPMATHNKIEKLSDVGGLSTGDALTSFDKEAFTSFGLEQGANAAMSEAMVKTYVSSLNHLLRNHARRMAGVKFTHWYSGTIPLEDDPILEILEGFGLPRSTDDENADVVDTREADRSVQAESRARQLLDAIRSGQRPDLANYQYFSLALSANSGRVVVRDWMEGQFTDLVVAVAAWFDDLSIVGRDGKDIIRAHKLAALIAATVRELKDAQPSTVASLWRCALNPRCPIPFAIMSQTLQRVRIDIVKKELRSARFALLKAYCNRKEGLPTMTAELNEFETAPAYLCGRILAILAKIQDKVMPDVNVNVVQRFYAAASATPALVLGRLMRNAQIAHLPKIESKGLRVWFDNQLAEVWGQLNRRIPNMLTLEEQTLFAMGYYHQLNARPKTEQAATDLPVATT